MYIHVQTHTVSQCMYMCVYIYIYSANSVMNRLGRILTVHNFFFFQIRKELNIGDKLFTINNVKVHISQIYYLCC